MQATAVIKQVELEAVRDLTATRQALAELVSHTRMEPGCLLFEIHEHGDRRGHFSLWEHFADQAAFNQHLEQAHTRAFFEAGWTRVLHRQDLAPLATMAPP